MAKYKKRQTANSRHRYPARLWATRLKQVQDFKHMSGTAPAKYGKLGSRRWGDELHRYLADKRVSREDVQRWMDTNSKVTEPLPELLKSVPKTTESPEQLFSVTGRPLRTCRHREIQKILASSSSDDSQSSEYTVVSSSSSSDNNQSSEYTVVSPGTFNSPGNPNHPPLYIASPLLFEDLTRALAALNVSESGIPNVTGATESSQSDSDPQTQERILTLNTPELVVSRTPQQELVSLEQAILKDKKVTRDKENIEPLLEMNSEFMEAHKQSETFGVQGSSSESSANSVWRTASSSGMTILTSTSKPFNTANNVCSPSSVRLEDTPPSNGIPNRSPENSESNNSRRRVSIVEAPITAQSNLRENFFTPTPPTLNSTAVTTDRNCQAFFSPSPIRLGDSGNLNLID